MATPIDVAVVGGGITGLTAAHCVLERDPGLRVALFEGSDRLGGKIHTTEVHGVRVETGADSFLARDDVVTGLCKDLGIDGELHPPAVFGALVWTTDGPKRLPPGTVMGVPASAGAVLRAEPLSIRGKLRALADLVLPGPLSGPDVAVGPFIRKRFGAEVLERMVDPILAGTRAGDPDRLSLSECMPQVDQAARTKRSVMSGLPKGSGPPPFLAPKGGMSRLIDALAASVGDADVRTTAPVRAVDPGQDGYRLTLDGEEIDVRSLVLAVPAPSAADLVRGFAADAAQGLRGLTHASVAAVTLVYPSGALTLPSGTSGFLVPNEAERMLSAGTWWSLKWPDSSPPDRTVVRAFVGRSSGDAAADEDDDALIERAAREIARLVGTRAGHVGGAVHRWPQGLPQYEVGHAEHIERIERSLYPHPGLILAGADYRGTGIPDCVRQGRAAAGAAIESLQGARGRKRSDGR